jgi:hypothetical protein
MISDVRYFGRCQRSRERTGTQGVGGFSPVETVARNLRWAIDEVQWLREGNRAGLRYQADNLATARFGQEMDRCTLSASCRWWLVVTLLHILARARGRSRKEAFEWSLSVFAKIFPVSFGRCRLEGNILVREQ